MCCSQQRPVLYYSVRTCAGTLQPAEAFILKRSKSIPERSKSISEQFVEKCESTRYPSNASLLQSINSNCDQQFDKFSKAIQNKIDVLNNEMQRKLEKLATRDDIAQTQKQQYPKDCDERRIESLKRLLHHQQAIHEDNNKMLKLLKDNLHYQNNVLFSVFICFVLAVLCLCLYNVFYIFLIVFIGFHLYYLCTLSYS